MTKPRTEALKTISPGAKLILGYIADNLDAEGVCRVSYRELSRHLGISLPTIWQGIRKLKETGNIKVPDRGTYVLSRVAVPDLLRCFSAKELDYFPEEAKALATTEEVYAFLKLGNEDLVRADGAIWLSGNIWLLPSGEVGSKP